MNIKIESIPPSAYPDYRLSVMFDGYKWDLQAGEQSTISDKVVLLGQDEMTFLADHAVRLYNETIAMEAALHKNPDMVRKLGISEPMTEALCNCNYKPEQHVRFMRFDFHPTTEGWKISEVNSDVPAGYPEASILPALAQVYFKDYVQYGNFGEIIKARLMRLIPSGSTVAYLHDTHTVEDYQILHYLGDIMETTGYKSMYASPEHIQWENAKAKGIGGIVRYFPVEWMEFTPHVDWIGYVNAQTPSCNHPIALLTQSKRLPLVWDDLGVDIPIWKMLLPETKCVNKLESQDGWILKPAFGRVGEGITIPGTMSEEEEQAVYQSAISDPMQWVAQRMFQSMPVDGFHLNVGVFVVDGVYAGCYGRISNEPRIDEDASEVPILIKERDKCEIFARRHELKYER
ncbi:MAG: glutathionylspermidine synthase family protein [Defluviitaleaceae bacterium]|nr:glutathionylspermidine synthase family protein [Defluviitaleaceae bacterium]